MSSRAVRRRLAGDRRGTTAIEFGFVGMIFFTMLLGAIELGRYQITLESVRNIAAEAARVALIAASPTAVQGGGCVALPSGGALKTSVTTPTNLTPMLTPGSLTLAPACATDANGVRTITVTASYPFQFVAPLLPAGLLTLTDSAALSY